MVVSTHRRTCFLAAWLFLIVLQQQAQGYFSYGGGNFSGLQQVVSNPAAAADNRLKFDLLLTGLDFDFNNSWFGIRRQALKYSGSIARPGQISFPASWRTLTPNVDGNVFKNFVFATSTKNRGLVLENRVWLPSAMLQLDDKNALAFTWSLRQMMCVDGLSPQLAVLFEKELDLSVTQNNRVVNRNLAATQMAWAEYGLTYGRVLKEKGEHFVKAGITPKILQGLEGAYLVVKDLDFLFSTKDTNSYFNTTFSYAHSANLTSPFKNDNPLASFYHRVAKPTLGMDIGLVYEWRPQHSNYLYRPDGKNYHWRRDLNKYRLRLGAALSDVGSIQYNKQGSSYDVDVKITRNNINKYTGAKNFRMFDSLLRADFSSANKNTTFRLRLPMALNLQADYAFTQLIYLNLSAHLTGFYKNDLYKLRNYTAICLAPRLEHYWFDVSLPLTVNALSVKRSKYLTSGLNLRLGPFTVGTNDVLQLFKGDVYAMNFFVLLRCAIPYKLIRDQDRDGVKDKVDECVDEFGEITLKGCPDKDHDNISDKNDRCPGQAGLPAFGGCPDTDGDGIQDAEDACPKEKGAFACKGCPDRDKDSIPDKDDACPDTPGPRKWKGCADSDNDGVVDKDDLCPAQKGLLKYKGCPDSDGDGVHDGLDACTAQKGPAENKGCPWPDTDGDGVDDRNDSCANQAGVLKCKGCPPPLILSDSQQRILEKAYANLEFASGKDVIKKSSFASLNALAKLLIAQQNDWQIRLSGHTDNVGNAESNLVLSEKRAKAVKRYLQNKGVPPEIILVEWFGATRQLSDNNSREGKQKNRRVEMVLLVRQ